MGPKWLLEVVLGVVVAFGFCQAGWPNNGDLNRLAKEGKQAYNAANYLEALAKWQQGLELAKKSGNQPAVADFLSNLGLVYDALGQYERALKMPRRPWPSTGSSRTAGARGMIGIIWAGSIVT